MDPTAPTALERSVQPPLPPDPQQGVIEEARRRQRRRRLRLTFAVAGTAGVAAVVMWALGGASRATPAHAVASDPAVTGNLSAAAAPAFNVRLAPALEVGQTGWEVFDEEHGAQAGGGGVGPVVGSGPYLGVFGSGVSGTHRWISFAVTTPNVAAILVDGKTRVPTIPVPGLPYGLRAARIVTPVTPAEERIPQGLGRRPEGPEPLVALDAQGRPVVGRAVHRTPLQGRVRAWEYPARTPRGACGLRANPLLGLTARGGQVASVIQPYPAAAGGGQIVGHAFLPCASVEYRLAGMSLKAVILLDAAHPGTRVAPLPDFKPVPGAGGFVAEGGLTARRAGDAWLVVGQGSGLGQRIELLRHLSVSVSLGSLVAASSGVRGAGQGSAPPPPVTRPVSLRVAPALEAGALGWEYVESDAGGGGGVSCCSLLTHAAEITSAGGGGGGPWWTAIVIAAPEVAAVSVEGRAPVPTRAEGLPYGLRFAFVPVKHLAGERLGVTPVAFDARGRRIATPGFETLPKRHQFEGPYAPHSWTAPAAPPAAPCELSAASFDGLAPLGGDMVLRVKGYRVFDSRAFQSCADTYYALGRATLQAAILLDAEHPGGTPAPLPYMTPAPGAAGVFAAPAAFSPRTASRELTAERVPGAWLVVSGGSGLAQRVQMLRHLHATISLISLPSM